MLLMSNLKCGLLSSGLGVFLFPLPLVGFSLCLIGFVLCLVLLFLMFCPTPLALTLGLYLHFMVLFCLRGVQWTVLFLRLALLLLWAPLLPIIFAWQLACRLSFVTYFCCPNISLLHTVLISLFLLMVLFPGLLPGDSSSFLTLIAL